MHKIWKYFFLFHRVHKVQMLTSKLELGPLADNGAVDVLDHAVVRPSVLLLLGVVDH